MSLLDDFLSEIEAFLEQRHMDPTTFGREALKDPNFIRELRKGRSPQLRTIERVREFMKPRKRQPSRNLSRAEARS